MFNTLASPLLILRVPNVIVQPSASTVASVVPAQVLVNEQGGGLWKGRDGKRRTS